MIFIIRCFAQWIYSNKNIENVDHENFSYMVIMPQTELGTCRDNFIRNLIRRLIIIIVIVGAYIIIILKRYF